jgi:3-methyl-2-oxobutanoate hydroxymethyltransferase
MSTQSDIKKITIPDIVTLKKEGKKVTALTAYDYLMARMLDEAGIDIILVGDSLGMVVAGQPNTLSVSMDQMIYHTAIVSRAVKTALLVGDMPFMSYQVSIEKGIENAGRFLQEAGAEAVKIEGGQVVLPLIEKLIRLGIPVMGHLGLLPQSIHKYGSYKLQGKDPVMASQLKEDALLLQDAGCFSIVLEKIPVSLAQEITQMLDIPTIGIGAGPFCDGQILVSYDMLGIFDQFKPRFVRRYANLADQMRKAFQKYITDVQSGRFPTEDESFK